ncbi:MAG: ABC transporter ATP-binding protein [Clostridia bacterium]
MENIIIQLKGIEKEFGEYPALKGINLSIREGEFVTLLGPSGCGKTTTLRIIGGFETATRGDIIFEGMKINDLPPHKRKLNTVFQKYALFTHMNVYENIAFGPRISGMSKDNIREAITDVLRIVNLKGFENRDVSTLSGGQQQRVAIARALINKPKVLLLDEPLGALDLKLRQDMQMELKNIHKELGITFIYVTHDQEEALTMSDTIVVMNEGEIQQIGNPETIYNEPFNAFIADFIGESNILDALMVEDFLVEFAGAKFPCVDKEFGRNKPVHVVIRPEDIEVMPAGQGKIRGIVESVTFKGVHYEVMIRSEGTLWMIHTTAIQQVGSEVGLDVLPFNIHIMNKEKDIA